MTERRLTFHQENLQRWMQREYPQMDALARSFAQKRLEGRFVRHLEMAFPLNPSQGQNRARASDAENSLVFLKEKVSSWLRPPEDIRGNSFN